MSESKYPYIPREYYAATMFACKMIRENGYFNKAIKIAANYYQVDETILKEHVRKRQGAGQKGSRRKYQYYLLLYYELGFYGDEGYPTTMDWSIDDYIHNLKATIVRAINLDNAEKAIRHRDTSLDHFNNVILSKAFSTKKEAEKHRFSMDEVIAAIKAVDEHAR